MPNPRIITSPLSGPFTEGDTTVDVQIYRLEDSLWTLAVIDSEGSSTVFSEPACNFDPLRVGIGVQN